MKKLLVLLPLLLSPLACTTVVDTPEPVVTRESSTTIHTDTGYPAVPVSSSRTTTVVR